MSGGRPFVGDWRNAVRDSELRGTVKLVALVLSTYMSGAGTTGPTRKQTPSIMTLARGATLGSGGGWKDNTAVKNAIAELEAEGLLEVERRGTRGTGGWFYTAVLPRADVGVDGDEGGELPHANEKNSHTSGLELPQAGVGESGLESEILKAVQHHRERREPLETDFGRDTLSRCDGCGNMFGHALDCPRASRAQASRTLHQGDCTECGYGGARPHLADCSLGAEAQR